MDNREVLSPQVVFAAISGATKVDAQERTQSEAFLQKWEKDAAPGFLSSLLTIARQVTMVDEASRLLAAVVAKNTVGSSWRKTIGSREWSRVPDGEKAEVRAAALDSLFSDPSERVGVQMALLIANIARFDFPTHWPTLLTQLAEASAFDGPTSLAIKRRAQRALKHVVKALRNKRIVAEAPTPAAGRMSRSDLVPLAERIAQERRQLNQQAEAIFNALKDLWQQNFAVVLQGGADWEVRGELANQTLLVLREILYLLPTWDGIEASVRQFLEAVHAAASAVASVVPAGEGENGNSDLRASICGKAFERMTQCIMAAMDRNPLEFAAYLPYFLPLYSSNALISMDAAAVHSIRPKRRILLIRFIARALLCPVFNLQWLDAQMPLSLEGEHAEQLKAVRPAIEAADKALEALVLEEQCLQLVEAIVTKYLALSPQELEEWQVDPEGYVRSTDVESSPDADTTRPCGVALLLCMLDRGGDSVAGALVKIASRLQATQPRTPEVVLLQEACYRGLGEALSREEGLPQVDFASWYTGELRALIQPVQAESGVHHSALQARAIWLVGICNGKMTPELWGETLSLVVQHMAHPDLVVALTAVSALVGLISFLLEEEAVIEETKAMQERIASHEDSATSMMASSRFQEAVALSQAEQRVHEAKLGVLQQQSGALVTLALSLQGRLEEIESRVRVLQLVSLTVEALGDKVQSSLGAIAEALPQVWTVASQASNDARETGAVARLHSALMAVLTHLVNRLGTVATQHPQISQVLLPLLDHGIDVSNPESETLVEDAVKLLSATLSGSQQLPPSLLALLPKLIQVMRWGKENVAAFRALEGFLVLGGVEVIQPHLQAISLALERTINIIANSLATSTANGKVQKPGQLSMEVLQEGIAAASLCTLLLQNQVDPSLFERVLRGMATIFSDKAIRGPEGIRLGHMAEGFLEVISRLILLQPQALQSLLGGDPDTEARFIDNWLAIAGTRYLQEVLGNPTMLAIARLRRHIAAASLSSLICARTCAAMQDTRRLARALVICLRALQEHVHYETDQQDIRQLIQERARSPDAARDTVMQRRMQLTQQDPLRTLDPRPAVVAAVHAALSYTPRTELVDMLRSMDSSLAGAIERILDTGDAGGALVSAPEHQSLVAEQLTLAALRAMAM